MAEDRQFIMVSAATLRGWPLPQPDRDGDKEVQETPVILGALAMAAIGEQHRFDGQVLLTPRAGEMARLTNQQGSGACRPRRGGARRCKRLERGSGPERRHHLDRDANRAGQLWRHDGGNIGLASSGSGDALAGPIAWLAARGAPLEQAAAWGMALHAKAGVLFWPTRWGLWAISRANWQAKFPD